jgi:acyl-CoA thioester hydrolase
MTLPLEPASGRFDGALHRFAVRVYYEDTDLSGLVYHANYLRWFERARSDMLTLLGIDQRAAVEAGEGFYAVAEANMRFLSPARLQDAVIIESRAVEIGAASVRIDQRALRHEGGKATVLVQCAIRVGFVSPEGRPRRQPSEWRAAFEQLSVKEPA